MLTNRQMSAAAERIRRHHAGEEIADKAELFADYESLYLAEHPADGDEPATAKWFVSTYGTWHYDLGGDFILAATKHDNVVLHAEGDGIDVSIYQMFVPTRGQVRHLLAAFGQ